MLRKKKTTIENYGTGDYLTLMHLVLICVCCSTESIQQFNCKHNDDPRMKQNESERLIFSLTIKLNRSRKTRCPKNKWAVLCGEKSIGAVIRQM